MFHWQKILQWERLNNGFFLVLKVVLHAVVVSSEVLRSSTKSRCSRCCRGTSLQGGVNPIVSLVHPCPLEPKQVVERCGGLLERREL